MILTHYELDKPIEFTDGKINVLVIENPALMTRIIEELLRQSDGGDGGFEIFEKDASIAIPNNIEIIVDPFSADVNERDILNKLYTVMKKDALDEELFVNTNAFLSDVETKVREIIERQPLLLESNTPDLAGLFKLLDVRFLIPDSLVERITDYIDTCSEYRKTKLFVFINLKSFLDKAEIIQLYAHSIYHKKQILLIENKQFSRVEDETIRVIDTNLCEIPVWKAEESKDNDIY